MTVETADRRLSDEFSYLTPTREAGDAPGARITRDRVSVRRGLGESDILYYSIDTAPDVNVALLGCWLLDRARDRAITRVTIDGCDVDFTDLSSIQSSLESALGRLRNGPRSL